MCCLAEEEQLAWYGAPSQGPDPTALLTAQLASLEHLAAEAICRASVVTILDPWTAVWWPQASDGHRSAFLLFGPQQLLIPPVHPDGRGDPDGND